MNETDIRNRIATVVLVKQATPHEAADRILALIAEAMLSDEAVGKVAERLLWLQLDGVMPNMDDIEEDQVDAAWAAVEDINSVALAAAGITPGDAREGGEGDG